MNILQFIAAIVGAVAWPVLIFFTVLLLRKPLGQVLLTLTRLRYKDLELDFGTELKKLERAAKVIEVSSAQQAAAEIGGPKEPKELLEEADRLSAEFPEPAVAVAWSAIEGDLRKLSERSGKGEEARREPSVRLIAYLQNHGILDKSTVDVLKRMSNLRNLAVHERWNAFGGVSPDEAGEFIAIARGLNEKFSSLPEF